MLCWSQSDRTRSALSGALVLLQMCAMAKSQPPDKVHMSSYQASKNCNVPNEDPHAGWNEPRLASCQDVYKYQHQHARSV